jgi:hypothetical protein
MPQEADLPADIKDLAYRNSVELTHARWDSDVQLLINALRGSTGDESAERATDGAAASGTSHARRNADAGDNHRGNSSGKRMWTIGGALAAVALMGAVVLKMSGPAHEAKADPTPASEPVLTAAAPPPSQPDNSDQMVSKKELQRRAHVRGACVKGYVWRQAQPGDKVCVSQDTQMRILAENKAAADTRSPTGGVYGPNTCKNGYVWREAYEGDVVCVTPDSRQLTANDNAQGAQRIVPLPQ